METRRWRSRFDWMVNAASLLSRSLEGLWKSWPIAVVLSLIGGITSYWALHTSLLPGISIGLLAFAAGIMSIRPEMKLPEKMSWVVILSCLLNAEVRSIHNDRRTSEMQAAEDRKSQDKSFGEVIETERKSFAATATSLKSGYELSQKQFTATVKESRNTDRLVLRALDAAKQSADNSVGGNSFAYLEIDEMSQDLELKKIGEAPLYDVHVRIQSLRAIPNYPDTEMRMIEHRELDLGNIPPGTLGPLAAIRDIPPQYASFQTDQIRMNFLISFSARNGFWTEHLWYHFIPEKSGLPYGHWARALVVYRGSPPKKKALFKLDNPEVPDKDLGESQSLLR